MYFRDKLGGALANLRPPKAWSMFCQKLSILQAIQIQGLILFVQRNLADGLIFHFDFNT